MFFLKLQHFWWPTRPFLWLSLNFWGSRTLTGCYSIILNDVAVSLTNQQVCILPLIAIKYFDMRNDDMDFSETCFPRALHEIFSIFTRGYGILWNGSSDCRHCVRNRSFLKSHLTVVVWVSFVRKGWFLCQSETWFLIAFPFAKNDILRFLEQKLKLYSGEEPL